MASFRAETRKSLGLDILVDGHLIVYSKPILRGALAHLLGDLQHHQMSDAVDEADDLLFGLFQADLAGIDLPAQRLDKFLCHW